MVPYSLTRKKQEPKKTFSKSKRKVTKNDDKNDSDSDGEPVSFFSHLEDSRPSTDTPGSASGDNDLSTNTKSDSTYPVAGYRTYGEPTGTYPTTDPQSQWYTGQYDTGVQGYPNSEFASQIDHNEQGYGSQYGTGVQGYSNSGVAEQTGYNVQGFTSGYPGRYTDSAATEEETTAEAMPGPGPGLSIDDEVVSLQKMFRHEFM